MDKLETVVRKLRNFVATECHGWGVGAIFIGSTSGERVLILSADAPAALTATILREIKNTIENPARVKYVSMFTTEGES